MVGCSWYGLRELSPFALHSLTLNFSYNETSTKLAITRYTRQHDFAVKWKIGYFNGNRCPESENDASF